MRLLNHKLLIQVMVLLMIASPLLGIGNGKALAATSRVAVIKSMTGTVQVTKAGGSKQFKAFSKMSLNEGDVVTTSANSTAVLQFSNGTSEDDKMSVSANTTLTFSKLSDRNGTRTKVSMFNGTAWVDVKSIASKNDEFTLETPTAVMGVRGTHLLVSVDPFTGATKLTVAAGVVHTQATGNSEAQDVKPGDNALITQGEQKQGEVTIAPVDLELLMQQSDKSIVEAIVSASGDIVKENQQKLDQYFESTEQQNNADLNRKKTNVENLLGAIVDNAVKSGQITQDRVNQLVSEAQAQTGVKIDLSKKDQILSDEEKKKQEDQRRKNEEAQKQAEIQKQKQEEERKKNEELNKKLEAEWKAKEEANRKAEEERKKKAQEEYEKKLSEAEKARFAKDAAAAAVASSPTPTPAASTSTTPSTSIPDYSFLGYVSISNSGKYYATFPQNVNQTIWKAYLPEALTNASLTVYPTDYSSKIVFGGAEYAYGTSIPLTVPSGESQLQFKVKSAIGNITGPFTVNVVRIPEGYGKVYSISSMKVNGSNADYDVTTYTYTATVPATASEVVVNVQPERDWTYSAFISVNKSDYSGVTGQSDGYHVILNNTGVTTVNILVTSFDQSHSQLYRLKIARKPAGVADWSFAYSNSIPAKWAMIEDSTVSDAPNRYKILVPDDVESVTMNVYLQNEGAEGYLYQGAGGYGDEMAYFDADHTFININSLVHGYNRFQLYVPNDSDSVSELTDIVIIRGAVPESSTIPSLSWSNIMWGEEGSVIPTNNDSFAIFAGDTDSIQLSLDDVYYADMQVDAMGQSFLHYDREGNYTIDSEGQSVQKVLLKYYDPILSNYRNHTLWVYFHNIPDSLKLSNVSITDVTDIESPSTPIALTPLSESNPVGYGDVSVSSSTMKVRLNVETMFEDTQVIDVVGEGVAKEGDDWYINLPEATIYSQIKSVQVLIQDQSGQRMTYDIIISKDAGEFA